jgi:hypothetical protein
VDFWIYICNTNIERKIGKKRRRGRGRERREGEREERGRGGERESYLTERERTM